MATGSKAGLYHYTQRAIDTSCLKSHKLLCPPIDNVWLNPKPYDGTKIVYYFFDTKLKDSYSYVAT